MDAAVFERVSGVDLSSADRAGLTVVLADLRSVRGWLECWEARCARRLADLEGAHSDPLVEQTIATASHQSTKTAAQTLQRAKTLAAHRVFEDALGQGRVSAAHVDVITRAAARLDPAGRERLAIEGLRLVGLAAVSTPEEFDQTLARETVAWEDREARLVRQRRGTGLKHWTDKTSGMVCLHGRFDPERGRTLVGRIDGLVKDLADGELPADGPSDPEAPPRPPARPRVVGIDRPGDDVTVWAARDDPRRRRTDHDIRFPRPLHRGLGPRHRPPTSSDPPSGGLVAGAARGDA